MSSDIKSQNFDYDVFLCNYCNSNIKIKDIKECIKCEYSYCTNCIVDNFCYKCYIPKCNICKLNLGKSDNIHSKHLKKNCADCKDLFDNHICKVCNVYSPNKDSLITCLGKKCNIKICNNCVYYSKNNLGICIKCINKMDSSCKNCGEIDENNSIDVKCISCNSGCKQCICKVNKQINLIKLNEIMPDLIEDLTISDTDQKNEEKIENIIMPTVYCFYCIRNNKDIIFNNNDPLDTLKNKSEIENDNYINNDEDNDENEADNSNDDDENSDEEDENNDYSSDDTGAWISKMRDEMENDENNENANNSDNSNDSDDTGYFSE